MNQLILKGMNISYDAVLSEFKLKDYAFSKLHERYKMWTGSSFEDKLFESFEICNSSGQLTYAGALIADNSPIRHSRIFCNRWNGTDKSGGIIDALDSAEYSGSLIILLNEGMSFVKRNMKTKWKKTPDSRIEMPDFIERSIFEALVNALIHHDYAILGSEVHIDIYDDRLTVSSPGGMPDGTKIQDRDIFNVSSTRRNPILADIFGRLGYMERQGSGFKKITEAYRTAYSYTPAAEPQFYSDASSFQVILFNLNYSKISARSDYDKKEQIKEYLHCLKATKTTKSKAVLLFETVGFEEIFGRRDIMRIIGLTYTPAGTLINKLKESNLIEPVRGRGKGIYKFTEPDNKYRQNHSD